MIRLVAEDKIVVEVGEFNFFFMGYCLLAVSILKMFFQLFSWSVFIRWENERNMRFQVWCRKKREFVVLIPFGQPGLCSEAVWCFHSTVEASVAARSTSSSFVFLVPRLHYQHKQNLQASLITVKLFAGFSQQKQQMEECIYIYI